MPAVPPTWMPDEMVQNEKGWMRKHPVRWSYALKVVLDMYVSPIRNRMLYPVCPVCPVYPVYPVYYT